MEIIRALIEFVMDILETVVFIGSLFIVIYLFIVAPNQVKGASMEPTFYTGDYIFTSRMTYRFRSIERGDVIVLKSPMNQDIEFIKRIIGLPGEHIMVRDGKVYINDKLLDESYLSVTTPLWGEEGFLKEGEEYTVPSDEVFVMGDNRPKSADSRQFGPIPISSIIGQVFYRYFPTSKMGQIKNPFPIDVRHKMSWLFVPFSEFFKQVA